MSASNPNNEHLLILINCLFPSVPDKWYCSAERITSKKKKIETFFFKFVFFCVLLNSFLWVPFYEFLYVTSKKNPKIVINRRNKGFPITFFFWKNRKKRKKCINNIFRELVVFCWKWTWTKKFFFSFFFFIFNKNNNI